MTDHITDQQESIEKLQELIKDIDIAMLTTQDVDGSLRSRPMGTQEVEFDGDLWFFTDDETAKVYEIQHQRHVNVSYADPKSQTYVSVSGTASVVRDSAKIKELWSPLYKAWFPEGVDDPNLVLLKINVEKAEYWDSPHGTVMTMIGFVKAIVTGQSYEPGDHDKLNLN
jgi:general stress protein 26